MVAAAVAPATFARSLGPRSAVDQGIVTGLVTGLTYATTVATQDALTALASVVHREREQIRRRVLLVDLASIPVGLAVGRALTVRDDERPLRSLLRQAAWRSGATGLGGAVFLGVDAVARRLNARLGTGGRLGGFPLALPAGRCSPRASSGNAGATCRRRRPRIRMRSIPRCRRPSASGWVSPRDWPDWPWARSGWPPRWTA